MKGGNVMKGWVQLMLGKVLLKKKHKVHTSYTIQAKKLAV